MFATPVAVATVPMSSVNSLNAEPTTPILWTSVSICWPIALKAICPARPPPAAPPKAPPITAPGPPPNNNGKPAPRATSPTRFLAAFPKAPNREPPNPPVIPVSGAEVRLGNWGPKLSSNGIAARAPFKAGTVCSVSLLTSALR